MQGPGSRGTVGGVTGRPISKNPWLAMSPLPRAIGIVMLVVGAVWIMQGIGLAQGSVMTGKTIWAVLGAAFVIGGGVILQRANAKAKAAIAAAEAADAAEAAAATAAEPNVSDDRAPDA
jgi:hypothetical protein